jgi:hypothetical protein
MRNHVGVVTNRMRRNGVSNHCSRVAVSKSPHSIWINNMGRSAYVGLMTSNHAFVRLGHSNGDKCKEDENEFGHSGNFEDWDDDDQKSKNFRKTFEEKF